MYTKEDEVKAAELGRAAFDAGINAPALDPAMRAMIKPGSKPGEILPILDAWTRAWHTANAASVTEPVLGDDTVIEHLLRKDK